MSDLPVIRLSRHTQNAHGTFGKLYLPDYVLETCEDDWQPKTVTGSCIPAGDYLCTRTVYYKYGYETFLINVPGWQRVLFHPGNTENDTRGCVLVGTRPGTLWVPDEDYKGPGQAPIVEKQSVANSQIAFKRMMDRLVDLDKFNLQVRWNDGLPKAA